MQKIFERIAALCTKHTSADVLHVVISAIIVIVLKLFLPVIVACSAAYLFALLKQVYNERKLNPKDFSLKELSYDLVGIIIGGL